MNEWCVHDVYVVYGVCMLYMRWVGCSYIVGNTNMWYCDDVCRMYDVGTACGMCVCCVYGMRRVHIMGVVCAYHVLYAWYDDIHRVPGVCMMCG